MGVFGVRRLEAALEHHTVDKEGIPMKTVNLALVGFGNVGRAFARLLARKHQDIREKYGLDLRITGIATRRHGTVIAPEGLDLEVLLDRMQRGADLNGLSPHPVPGDTFTFIQKVPADVLLELTPVNYDTGEPALTHIRMALQRGMHAVTANKGPVVHGYRELQALAREQGRAFYFESAVMDGAPVFALFRETLPAARLVGFEGILNSTTNLVLTRMETHGETLEQAVAYAQKIGIAETDPSGDIDGWDAAIKVAALVTVLMGEDLKPHQVEREGISRLTPADIHRARDAGRRWKLVCRAYRENGRLVARVQPEQVPASSPLYNVMGTSCLIRFETDVLGDLSLREDDPTPETTAYGLLADVLNAVR